ncbi:cell division protein FtsN [Thalassovita gelatinovora]|uniref:Cell division protein FtsN n=1 Tax=Thalassovita gelatinovora TaxID=53501 RepID=A0A0N7LW85_THAGE|nr:cell division protein FtsN [Thalassovita gelatinovora]SER18880.1 Sporulation related domain-containing protein [Thalassovita gelatinovora]
MVLMTDREMNFTRLKQGLVIAGLAIGLSGCEDGANFNLFQKKPQAEADATPARSVKLIERDIEAPEVFQKTEAGLWDGRPSLGGVWVAHPDVTDPERVIIRNEANGKFVIGALFRREREIPGPRFQVSSDAAAAMSMLAGKPVELSVTALRREEVAEEQTAPDSDPEAMSAPAEIESKPLDPVSVAGAAIDKAEAKETPARPAAAPTPKPAPKPTAKVSKLSKPYLQIGIFSVEENAQNAAATMKRSGMIPTVKKASLKGKTYWRVLVGPATTDSERSALLDQIKKSGFTDAYAVSN